MSLFQITSLELRLPFAIRASLQLYDCIRGEQAVLSIQEGASKPVLQKKKNKK